MPVDMNANGDVPNKLPDLVPTTDDKDITTSGLGETSTEKVLETVPTSDMPIKYLLDHALKNYGQLDIVSSDAVYDDSPLACSPFLPPPAPDVMTLLLDMDSTLIYCSENEGEIEKPDFLYMEKFGDKGDLCFIKVRDQLDWFLETAAKFFEITVFTAAYQGYADSILDRIDPHKFIKHRLYRQHCSMINNKALKDLSKIGRDLDSVVIVDDLPFSYTLHPFNGIPIPPIRCDSGDNAFRVVMEILREIACRKSVEAVLGEKNKDYVEMKIGEFEYFDLSENGSVNGEASSGLDNNISKLKDADKSSHEHHLNTAAVIMHKEVESKINQSNVTRLATDTTGNGVKHSTDSSRDVAKQSSLVDFSKITASTRKRLSSSSSTSHDTPSKMANRAQTPEKTKTSAKRNLFSVAPK